MMEVEVNLFSDSISDTNKLEPQSMLLQRKRIETIEMKAWYLMFLFLEVLTCSYLPFASSVF